MAKLPINHDMFHEMDNHCSIHGFDEKVMDFIATHDINSANNNGDIFYHRLFHKCKTAKDVEMLFQYGADVAAQDGRQREILFEAWYSYREVIQAVLAFHPNINQQDRDGMTPLMHGASVANYDLAELLLQHGADVSLKNNEGQDVFYFVSQCHEKYSPDNPDLLKIQAIFDQYQLDRLANNQSPNITTL